MFYYHRLTFYIEVLDQKTNSFNKYAICLACLEIKGCSYALEKQFTNTKKCCKDHFKKYKFFYQKYRINEAQAIIDDTDSEVIKQMCQEKRFHIHKDDNNRSSNYASSSVSIVSKFSTNNGPLDNLLIVNLLKQMIDISSERAHTEEIKNKINEITKSVTNKEIKVAAIVTDIHSSYAAARKQLQVENPQITYLSCFAYQTNLCIGEIFKKLNLFKNTALKATLIAVYFKSKQYAYFTGKLHNI
ncbi:245_t:CDS:2 [Cetraspora pellucida]|uniref:245_t:CDS:1 n=1 Tax=Cetraspora pellucida TaxID=1433469 RepID=A0A9N8WCP4_9GLOM|nr:245_t:CDS:2 [Cetraspora pellucida]